MTTLSFDLSSPTSSAAIVASRPLAGGLPVDVAVDSTGASWATVEYAGPFIQSTTWTMPSDKVGSTSATSVALDDTGQVYLFTRQPAGFVVLTTGAALVTAIPVTTATSVADTGHDLFHHAAQPGGALACASCHPEGRDDGRVWNFIPQGLRRTPSLVGGLLATAPYHWDGSLTDVSSLMTEVFTGRMGGDIEDGPHVAAVSRFLEAIPRVPLSPVPASAVASVAHGMALFQSATLGCTGCHSGAHYTDNATVDVGTGQAFQVPTLIGVGLRAPFLHDGCAATLTDRFGSCGGPMHGSTSQLSTSDIANLVNYLDTL